MPDGNNDWSRTTEVMPHRQAITPGGQLPEDLINRALYIVRAGQCQDFFRQKNQ
jgi:hypothetical protein